jgi:hypothetical protein
LVWVVAVGREPRAAADVVVKDVEAWSPFYISAPQARIYFPLFSKAVQSVDALSAAVQPETEKSNSLRHLPPVLLPLIARLAVITEAIAPGAVARLMELVTRAVKPSRNRRRRSRRR